MPTSRSGTRGQGSLAYTEKPSLQTNEMVSPEVEDLSNVFPS